MFSECQKLIPDCDNDNNELKHFNSEHESSPQRHLFSRSDLPFRKNHRPDCGNVISKIRLCMFYVKLKNNTKTADRYIQYVLVKPVVPKILQKVLENSLHNLLASHR